MSRKNEWTHEEKTKLIEMRESGHTYREISEKIGRSQSACQNKASDLGIQTPYWTTEQEKKLLEWFESGIPYSEMAEKTGKSENACHQKIRLLTEKRRLKHKRRKK